MPIVSETHTVPTTVEKTTGEKMKHRPDERGPDEHGPDRYKSPRRVPRRRRWAGTVAIAGSVALSAVGTQVVTDPAHAAGDDPSGSAQAAAASSAPLRVWAPKRVVVRAYGKQVYDDLGVQLIAGSSPFEVRTTRASYKVAPVTKAIIGDREVTLPVPASAPLGSLPGFTRLTLTPKSGGQARVINAPTCFSNYAQQRITPSAPATSPYPDECTYNAYSLGTVQGLQAGWALSPYLDRSFKIATGRYDATVQIAPRYAKALGLSTAQSSRAFTLVVKKGADGRRKVAETDGDIATPAAHPPTGKTASQTGVADSGPRPDLRSMPAWGISLNKKGTVLRFSATVWNGGDSPLVVDGFRRGNKPVMDAYQYFFDADGNQTGYEPVGTMEWDNRPSHFHWHFHDFARYSLLDANKKNVKISGKESFCLANTDAADLTVSGAAWRPDNTDLATACGDQSSISLREVLASGWGDTYTQYRAGQAFDISKLPNGTYFISVNANPHKALVEQSYTNNQSLRKIRIKGTAKHRRVVVSQIGIIDHEGYGGTG
ncbi:MAG: lysyl oxidase family protein [Nocardioides sp.]|uniref:lysyl oxidase family protein n=1 Tax=Nocardioides sp. TaxID=35761 RepID=UPI0039E57038